MQWDEEIIDIIINTEYLEKVWNECLENFDFDRIDDIIESSYKYNDEQFRFFYSHFVQEFNDK